LTKFKEDMKKSDTKNLVGSVHWAAPEVCHFDDKLVTIDGVSLNQLPHVFHPTGTAGGARR
jgi:hypothetical protein